MRAGVIVNPRSGKSSGHGLALAGKLRGQANVSIKIIEQFEALPHLLQECAREGVTDLFISSGDGTIQAIQTELAERRPFSTLPRLCLLPHGTTNMTAADLGFRHRGLEAQARLILNPNPQELRQRPTLRAVNPRDGQPRHGMFIGTGAIADATAYCQRVFNARGVKGNWASFATLASAIGRTLFSTPDPQNPDRFDRPYGIEVSAGGLTVSSGTQLLMLATTLDKLILGTRPFWGDGDGPIRATMLPYPVPNLLRWTWPIMYGDDSRRGPPGAVSVRGSAFEVSSPVDFVLDGEFFSGPQNTPLRIECGPVFSYIRS
jgi:diacylglycerol kinase (ATP)